MSEFDEKMKRILELQRDAIEAEEGLPRAVAEKRLDDAIELFRQVYAPLPVVS